MIFPLSPALPLSVAGRRNREKATRARNDGCGPNLTRGGITDKVGGRALTSIRVLHGPKIMASRGSSSDGRTRTAGPTW